MLSRECLEYSRDKILSGEALMELSRMQQRLINEHCMGVEVLLSEQEKRLQRLTAENERFTAALELGHERPITPHGDTGALSSGERSGRFPKSEGVRAAPKSSRPLQTSRPRLPEPSIGALRVLEDLVRELLNRWPPPGPAVPEDQEKLMYRLGRCATGGQSGDSMAASSFCEDGSSFVTEQVTLPAVAECSAAPKQVTLPALPECVDVSSLHAYVAQGDTSTKSSKKELDRSPSKAADQTAGSKTTLPTMQRAYDQRWSLKASKSASKTHNARLTALPAAITDWLNQQLTVPPTFERRDVRKSMLERFVEGWCFSTMSAALIIMYAVYIGVYAEFTIQNEFGRITGGEFEARWWIMVQLFNALFLVEIVLRAIAERKYFIFGKNAIWNAFDTLVVFLSMSNLIMQGDKEAAPQVSYLRILRLARVINTFEMFRLPFFSYLRMITNSMVKTLPVCVWATCIGALNFYFFSVAFVLGVGRFLQLIKVDKLDADMLADIEMLRTFFSSLSLSMMHLYMGISGGIDFLEIYESLTPLSIWYRFGFLLFTVIMLFGVLNVITGMVIERAFKVVKQDRDFWIVEAARERFLYDERVRGLFYQMDLDNSGCVCWEEFTDAMNNPLVEAYLSFIELDSADLADIFMLLDKDDSGSIELQEFQDGIFELKGAANKVQLKQMEAYIKDVAAQLEDLEMIQDAEGLAVYGTTKSGGRRTSIRPSHRGRTLRMGDNGTPQLKLTAQSGPALFVSGRGKDCKLESTAEEDEPSKVEPDIGAARPATAFHSENSFPLP